jgi:hypothetical protein
MTYVNLIDLAAALVQDHADSIFPILINRNFQEVNHPGLKVIAGCTTTDVHVTVEVGGGKYIIAMDFDPALGIGEDGYRFGTLLYCNPDLKATTQLVGFTREYFHKFNHALALVGVWTHGRGFRTWEPASKIDQPDWLWNLASAIGEVL